MPVRTALKHRLPGRYVCVCQQHSKAQSSNRYQGQSRKGIRLAKVPLDRALVISYDLSIATMSLSAAVWPQFATQVFGRGASTHVW